MRLKSSTMCLQTIPKHITTANTHFSETEACVRRAHNSMKMTQLERKKRHALWFLLPKTHQRVGPRSKRMTVKTRANLLENNIKQTEKTWSLRVWQSSDCNALEEPQESRSRPEKMAAEWFCGDEWYQIPSLFSLFTRSDSTAVIAFKCSETLGLVCF